MTIELAQCGIGQSYFPSHGVARSVLRFSDTVPNYQLRCKTATMSEQGVSGLTTESMNLEQSLRRQKYLLREVLHIKWDVTDYLAQASMGQQRFAVSEGTDCDSFRQNGGCKGDTAVSHQKRARKG